MAGKARRIKEIDLAVVAFVVFSLVSVSLLADSAFTGFVINKDMIGFNKRLCPDPRASVPVFREVSGGVGHKVLVSCVSSSRAVESQGDYFEPTRTGDIDTINVPEEPHKFYPTP